MEWKVFVHFVNMAATVAFTVTAVVAIRGDRKIDLFAATFLGLITAVGGGTIRDVVLGVRVFWASDTSYVWIACAASAVTFFTRRLATDRSLYRLMLYLDGFGAAMFAIAATGKVWDAGFGLPVAPVFLGVVTGIGGGLMRDVLVGRPTLLMRSEIYALPLLLGCTAFVLVLKYLPGYRSLVGSACIICTFAIRAAAIHWKLTLPDLALTGQRSSS